MLLISIARACFIASMFALVAPVAYAASRSIVPDKITVPIDRQDAALGSAALTLDYAGPFDPRKPVLFVVEDGQQFYVRPGAAKQLQRSLFGPGFNVVGLVPRGSTSTFAKAALRSDGSIDWFRAWRIFNDDEWIDDLEMARRTVAGPSTQIYLYGRSGGAYLVHQYLAKYGRHVARAFTQSAVNPTLNAQLGIPIDGYWDDLGRQGPALQSSLKRALSLHRLERVPILMTLQRQHFYVPPEQLPQARAALIASLASGRSDLYVRDRKAYEVDDILKLAASTGIVPQDVRVLELLFPSGTFSQLGDGGIHPLTESQAYFIRPLLALVHAGKIPQPSYDPSRAHTLRTEVFVLAGSEDEAVDYRTSIALRYLYPRGTLFIARDNHVFDALASSGTTSRIVHAFFLYGTSSPQLQRVLRAARRYRWVAS